MFGHQSSQTAHGIGMLTRQKMAVCVHSQRNGRVPHDGLDDVGMDAVERKPGAARVAQRMEVERFGLMVAHHQYRTQAE